MELCWGLLFGLLVVVESKGAEVGSEVEDTGAFVLVIIVVGCGLGVEVDVVRFAGFEGIAVRVCDFVSVRNGRRRVLLLAEVLDAGFGLRLRRERTEGAMVAGFAWCSLDSARSMGVVIGGENGML